jgi:Carboxypeptidase regulatory-like domain
MRSLCLRLCVFIVAVASLALGQIGNGTITGTVTDPANAVVPNAAVEAKNLETGVVTPTVSTSGGVYTIPELPIGTYSITAKVQGFKTYTHTNLALAALQTMKEDIALQVGQATDTVTVSAEASMLKTESGEMSHNITLSQLDDLPLLGVGTANSGTSGVRNPYNTLQILPGISGYASSGQFTLNGLGGTTTETMRVEGQDSTSRLFGTYDYTQMGQPSADSIQEIAYQTSNYSAEFGQAGSVVINMTMKSGTNLYHGTGFDYFVNEDLNAGDPFTINPSGVGLVRPRNRRNDFGGTLGGPVRIPKLYNGKNKTFFFFNYEEFLENTGYAFNDTVPTADYLNGNFSHISPNGDCSLCSTYGIPTAAITKDPAGNSVFANEIFDPRSRLPNGTAVPFSNNTISPSLFNSTSIALMKLFPAAQNNNLIGNYNGAITGNRYTAIPSIKVDEVLSSKDRLSFFWSRINTESQISAPLGNADGLPTMIGGYRGTFIPTYTTRLNYDRTITPTLLLHLGAGYYHTLFTDRAPFLSFDPVSLGLTGFLIHRQFPSFTGMSSLALGGMQNVGTSGQGQTLNYEEKPSFTANATWIRGNHTIKGGAEVYLEGVINGTFAGVTMYGGTGPTAEPFTPTTALNGQSMGFGFASFLLGDYGGTIPFTTTITSTNQTPQLNYKQGNQEWGLFLQDTWKVTRKLTVDYGLRWDFATTYKEQYGRLGRFDPTVPNADAGGNLGGTIYANTCNCPFYQKPYPYAIGPRLGVAYAINDKTVFRAGFGINYQFIANPGGATVTLNGTYPLTGINPYANISSPGSILTPVWPNTNPSRYPALSATGGPTLTGTPALEDKNELRPPRVTQWSVGIQRQITNSLEMEAAYVANRGVWLSGGPLGYFSQISPATYASIGLYPYPGTGPSGYNFAIPGNPCTPGNDCARALLAMPLNSAPVVAQLTSVGKLGLATPYPGFPGTTLTSALYPFPQFGNLNPSNSPTGDSLYNSLQVKLTKRLSRGLQAGGAYTWAKGLTRPAPQDFFNPNGSRWTLQQIPPQTLTFNVTYTVPRFSFIPKYANVVVRDWQVSWSANYQSGAFLAPPVNNTTAEFLTSEDVRNPGVPLYTVSNINDIHSYNPETQQVLNPKAWSACPVNTVCGSTSMLYSDFRGLRAPRESANIGRHFRIKEKYDFYIRAEFVNIFNRTILPNPSTASPQTAPAANGAGAFTGGFGVINVYQTPGSYPAAANPAYAVGRTGTLVARFQF